MHCFEAGLSQTTSRLSFVERQSLVAKIAKRVRARPEIKRILACNLDILTVFNAKLFHDKL